MDSFDRSRQYDNSLMSYWIFFPNQSVENYLEDILALAAHISSGYIWQNETFLLNYCRGSEEIELPHLFGSTDYGENVGDLWFITYILRRVTVQFEGLIVKLQDSDGEFLLIEAANHLPEWITPENVTNRVYLYEGELHIVPLASSPADITPLATGLPTISAAVQCVRSFSKVTRASQAVQDCLNKRLGRYPEQASADIHSTTCYLPVSAALLLADDPQLISTATRAFYLRDPIDIKACQNMRHFSPDNRVNVKVRLTRCLYAQLVQQKFFPPKRSIWNIPPANSPKHKSHDLGMKIAFGFEMLCASLGAKGDNSSAKDGAKDIDKVDGKKWAQYLNSLHKYNYFQGEVEGSVRHQRLLLEARRYFTANQEAFVTESNRSRETTGEKILHRLKESKVTEEELREAEQHLTPDDDDSWLSMTYNELDQLLEEYHSDKPAAVPSLDKKSTEFDTTQLADSMNAFINKQSNILSGAELPTSDELKFDGKGFLAAIEQMINGEDEAALDSDDSSLNAYESDDSLPSDELIESPGFSSAKPKQAGKTAVQNPTNSGRVTFNTTAGSQSTKSKGAESQKQEAEPKIEDFMAMMDRELSKTNVGKTFEKQNARKEPTSDRPEVGKGRATLAEEEDISDSDDALEPVDVDFNTVKNLLESYNQQMGLPGPTSNLIESMGLKLPQNADE